MRSPLRHAASGGGFQDTGRKRAETKKSLAQWAVHNKKDGTSEDMRQEGPALPEAHEIRASREEGDITEQNLFCNV